MEQRIIEKNMNQCIYFMRETNLDFYLIIPNTRRVKIVLGVFEEVNDNFVKKIPFHSDKAIVIPVIQKNILDQANTVGTQSFRYLEQVLSFLINTSYKLLTYNHVEVDSQVLFHYNSQYEMFHQNFLATHQGRVAAIELFPRTAPLVNESVPAPTIQQQEPKASLEGVTLSDIPVQSSVIDNSTSNVNDNTVNNKENIENVQVMTREPGFVSYVLLGVLVAVLSLVFLYFIL